jgi:hypothetical protein
MTELEMIKAFTDVDGDTCYVHKSLGIYNPITDLALNCAARDKYKVEIDYDDEACFIYEKDSFPDCVEVEFKGCIPRAVIECILKSKGKL